ncbi:transposase [Streptomyces olivoreticuli]
MVGLVLDEGPVGDGPLKIAVDVSPWPRPDAETSTERCHCYTACRCDGSRKTVPGWPYSFAAGLEWGASAWTALLDAVRIGPDDDATLATLCQVVRVVERLADTGLLADRPAPVFVFDSGYDLSLTLPGILEFPGAAAWSTGMLG